jgi:hypothetical protein
VKSRLQQFQFTPLESRQLQRLRVIPAELSNNTAVGITNTPIVSGTLNPGAPPIGGTVFIPRIDIAPRGHTIWHFHATVERLQVLSGIASIFIVQPDSSINRYIRYPGESLDIPANSVHMGLNETSAQLSVQSEFIVPPTLPLQNQVGVPAAVASGDVYEVLRLVEGKNGQLIPVSTDVADVTSRSFLNNVLTAGSSSSVSSNITHKGSEDCSSSNSSTSSVAVNSGSSGCGCGC